MKLHQLKKASLPRKSKRVGRGNSSGRGSKSGRGDKGQNSRSGGSSKAYFEGGQTSLLGRIPKLKGFNRKSKKIEIVKVKDINRLFKDGETVSPKTLAEKGLIKDVGKSVKVLGGTELKKKVKFEKIKTSKFVIPEF